ncbi:GAF domain-containing protein [Candidatus Saganbacteria bacterium]|nr:GAF domain-containing protein [Candidatus Saganbacteria bacterium]
MESLLLISSLAAAVALLLLGIFVTAVNRGSRLNHAFSFYLFILALWSIGIAGLVNTASFDMAMVWLKVMSTGVVFIPSGFIIFIYIFTEGKRRKLFTPIIAFGLSLIYLSLAYTNQLFDSVIKLKYGFVGHPHPGVIFPSFVLFVVVSSFYGYYLLLANYFSSIGRKREQSLYLLVSSFLYYVGALSVVPTLLGKTILGGFPIWSFTNVIFGGLITYSIVKQRLLDIPVVISKTSARLITYLFFSGVYTSIILFYFNFISMKPDWLFIAFTIAFGILGVESATPTRLAIQTSTDKLFLRGKYDYYYELEHIGADLANSAGFDELLTYLNDAFINNLEVGRPRLFIPRDGKTGDFYAWDLIEKKATPETIPKGSFIFEYFSEVKTVIEKGFEGSERLDRAFDETGAKLLIPCYFRNKLLGVLAFGDKLSQEEFTDEDIHLLKSISNQIGAALERAGAYEDLKAEVEKARAQMEISSRLSSLGTLAAGVTHEIRNPLAVIQSKLELLPDKLDDKEFLKNLSEVLPRHIERIVGLINRLLFFAKPEKHMTQKINICQVLQDTIDLVDGEAARRDIKIVKDLKDLEIMGDFSQLSQVFLNIMLNAVQSMGAGGEMRITTSTSNGWVAATISDTGPGIAPENLSKIFDPFFTTRAAGTGLGLAISRRIVEEHKGEISVVSEPGKGAVFTIKLPAY